MDRSEFVGYGGGYSPRLRQAMSDNPIIQLVKVARYYKQQPHQDKALEWFDASTGQQKQEIFARIYRNKGKESDVSGTPRQEPDIKFVDAFKHFEGTAWQVDALNWLQVNTQPKTLEEFAKLWRSVPPKPISNQSDYWQQMTHGGSRTPRTQEEKRNIEKACDMLEELERELKTPLILTSGFRPEPINSQVGGVPGSYHTKGLAADVYSEEIDDWTLQARIVDYWHYKRGQAVGRGAGYRGFVHVDYRGYPSLWDY